MWRNEVYLGHWIGFLPAQERMALARLDLDAGIVRYVHRFSHLSDEIESAQHPQLAQVLLKPAGRVRLWVGCCP